MKGTSKKVLREIFFNLLKANFILLYLLAFNLAYYEVDSDLLKKGTQIFTIIFLAVAIYIFEKAYKKDSGKKAIEGIEVLVLSSHALTIQHITSRFGFDFKIYLAASSYIFTIYFVLKSIFIYTRWKKEYASSLSDIAEIVKKEQPIIKEATKKNRRDENDNNEINNKDKQEKEHTKKVVKNSKENKNVKNFNKEKRQKHKKNKNSDINLKKINTKKDNNKDIKHDNIDKQQKNVKQNEIKDKETKEKVNKNKKR